MTILLTEKDELQNGYRKAKAEKVSFRYFYSKRKRTSTFEIQGLKTI